MSLSSLILGSVNIFTNFDNTNLFQTKVIAKIIDMFIIVIKANIYMQIYKITREF